MCTFFHQKSVLYPEDTELWPDVHNTGFHNSIHRLFTDIPILLDGVTFLPLSLHRRVQRDTRTQHSGIKMKSVAFSRNHLRSHPQITGFVMVPQPKWWIEKSLAWGNMTWKEAELTLVWGFGWRPVPFCTSGFLLLFQTKQTVSPLLIFSFPK